MTKEEGLAYRETCKNIIDSLPKDETLMSLQWRTIRDLYDYIAVYGEDADMVLRLKAEDFKLGVDAVVVDVKNRLNKDLTKETILWVR